MKTSLLLATILLSSSSAFACRERHMGKVNGLLNSPIEFDQGVVKLLYGNTLEYDVMKVLTGEERMRSGEAILQRGALEYRKLVWNYLEEQLKELGLEPQRHEYDKSAQGQVKATNIWATLPASISTNEYIVLGAHFDSVSNAGANDNASGSAIVMGLAQRLQNMSVRKKNIIFVFLDQEELGLIGAGHFARLLKELKYNVHSVHTIDQMAWDKDGDRAIELEMPHKDLLPIYQAVKAERGYTMTLHTTNVTSTDHHAFRREGFKAVGLTEEYMNRDTTPCYHSACDKFSSVNFEYLMNSSNFWSDVIDHIAAL